ncbi:MAG TPA: C40 family peptidase [Saprospiraceae bacterium]|nr:C40 family peptidase [Saprospiraceae bacterium]
MINTPLMLRFAVFFTLCLVVMASCGTSHHYGDRSERYARGRRPANSKPPRPSENEEKWVVKAESGKLKNSPPAPSNLRTQMVAEAMTYLGTPYKYAGKRPEEGFDCSGFANFIYNQYGFKTAGPSHELALMGVPKDRQQLQAGDLVFFGNEERISHVGIVTSGANGRIGFIHSSTSGGIRTDEVAGNEYWEKRYLFGRDLISGFMASK